MLVRFYDLLEEKSMHLSTAAQSEFVNVGNLFGAMYARLSTMCFDIGLKMWKLSPKHHLFVHLCCDQITMGNPRYWWCYGDEDLVRIMIGIADSVHPRTLAVSVLSKSLWCVFDQLLVDVDTDLDG